MLLVPYWEGGIAASSFSHPDIQSVLGTKDFQGKSGEVVLFYPKEGGRILLLGLGKKGEEKAEPVRCAFANAWKKIVDKKGKSVLFFFPKWDAITPLDAFRAVVEAAFLSNYAFDGFKKEKVSLVEELLISGAESKWEKEIERLQVITSGVHFVRDLVNGNAHDVGSERLAKEAQGFAKKISSIKTTILNKKQLEDEGMGLLLAVGQGAVEEPKLIISSYSGDPKSKEKIVLVGKGITFDTGGLSLKPTDNMLAMKSDMAGAATVLGVVRVAAELGLKVNVTAVAPVCENAIGSHCYKLGDVYRACNGKTVEILNTDAEGRLVLADAMSYAVKYLKPTWMIDVGTLTGSIVVALGEEIAGLFSNDEKVAKALEDSSVKTGEILWRLPLHDYREALKSDIADMINTGGREAGSMKCALLLQEFVGTTPWAHLDIAGVARMQKPKGYSPTKATGWGLRLLIDLLERR